MSKKKDAASESPQEIVLTLKPGDEPEESSLTDDGIALVEYRVSCPKGIYLRVGPGKGYLSMTVLPYGTEVWAADQEEGLRPDRLPEDAAWVNALTKDGTGWVDRAFLERIHG